MSEQTLDTAQIDRGVQPRSMNRLLTDNGVVDMDAGLTTPAPAETEATTEDAAIDELLDKADAASSSDEAKPTAEAPDFAAPEFAALNDQFKAALGVDIKEAYDRYNQMSQAFEQQQQQLADQGAQVAAKTLQEKWGVNEAEFNSRVQRVLDYTAKLSPAIRAEFDSIEGIDRLWGRISQRSGSAQPSATKVGAGGGQSQPQKFRKSELRDMMLKNPRLYSSMQAAIASAYESGNVLDDI